MKKLKIILQFNASKYVHISLLITLFLFAIKYPYLIILGIIYLLFLYRKSKSLTLFSILILLIITMRFIQVNQVKPTALPFNAEVIEVHNNYLIVKSDSKYIVYEEFTDNYKPGMIVYVEGKYIEYDQMNVEHNFNYNEYLKTQNIIERIDASQIKVIDKKWNINIVSYQLKAYFDNHYPREVSTYMKLFVLGYKDDLDESVTNLSNELGISHLFAISGMHLGLIVLLLNKILQLFYLKKQTYHFIIVLFLLFYNIITGFLISIVRASLFLFIIFMTNDSKYRFSSSDYLSFIMIVLIIINPYFIFGLGFQLSFLMAFILVLFKEFYINKKGLKRILYISIIAIVYSLPITLSIEKSIGILNVFINPLFVVYVSFIMLPGVIILLFFPFLSYLYLYFINGFEMLMVYATKTNLYINFNFSNSITKIFYWLLITFSILYYKKYKKRISLLWVLFIFSISHSIVSSNEVKVIMFDVNQAEASYIQTKDCKLLIDTGNPDDYNTLIHYFKGENIHSLDAIILTHQHQDHYGEINDILSELDVKSVYVSKLYEDVNLSVQKVVSKGDVINCGRTQIHVLNGDQGFANENNNSLVLYTVIKGENWLFTGDIEQEVEEMLIREYNFKIDHLKVAHHGSITSSTEAFIQHFQPKYAYISVGKNQYGLPSEKVIKDLYGVVDKLYITQKHGSIVNIYRIFLSYRYCYYDGKKMYEINLNM